MTIFIPTNLSVEVRERELFILVRPFKGQQGWCNREEQFKKWGLLNAGIQYTDSPALATVLLLPYSINTYCATNNVSRLQEYDTLCQQHGMKGYGYISGDWGLKFPEFKNLIYFRMGGFRSQLSQSNQGFPVSLSDQLVRIFGTTQPSVREKQSKPIIGFCGHASRSIIKWAKENLKVLKVNASRAFHNPFRKDWESLFPSAWHRSRLLKRLDQSAKVTTNFICREHYRAGATTGKLREETTLEYYNNIQQSDYVLCLRGGGNFSVRLYETLMMGRIPVFINTDCLLPFEDTIPWKEHVVWVEWKDRNKIDTLISTYHQRLSADQFRDLQLKNRELWLNTLSIKGMLEMLNVKHRKS